MLSMLVLQLAYIKEKLTNGYYLHKAMDKEKEFINTRLKNNIYREGSYISVIVLRWDKQLHNPFHTNMFVF